MDGRNEETARHIVFGSFSDDTEVLILLFFFSFNRVQSFVINELVLQNPKNTITKIRLPNYAVSIGAAVVVSSVYLPLSLPRAAKRPLALRSKIDLRSLSIFNFTMTHCNRNAHDLEFLVVELDFTESLYIPLTGEYRLVRLCRLSFHVGYAQCKRRIFFCRLG